MYSRNQAQNRGSSMTEHAVCWVFNAIWMRMRCIVA